MVALAMPSEPRDPEADDQPVAAEGDSFAALFAQSERQQPRGGRSRVKVGDLVKARINKIGASTVFLLIEGTPLEGVLDRVELCGPDGNLVAKEGDIIEARVSALGEKRDVVTLRRSMRKGTSGQAELEQAYKLGLPVEGTVTGANKGGVDVNIAGLRAFCPVSQLDGRPVDDVASFIGRKLSFRITKYETDDRGPNLIVSRRALLDEENKRRAVETRKKLVVGAVLPGVVSSLREFGAFVDLGGLDGLLPASEISFSRGVRPEDVLQVGQEVSVQVLRIEQTEDARRPEKISLSLKSLTDDPWQSVVAQFPVGAKVRARVTRLEAFGAFAELAPGIEGLIHISELGDGKQPLRHAREGIKSGAEVDVFVLQADQARRRIGLGLREREDVVDAEGAAAVRHASGSGSLGTFADLLRGKTTR